MSNEEIKAEIDFLLCEYGASLYMAEDTNEGPVVEREVAYNIGVLHGIRWAACQILGDKAYVPVSGNPHGLNSIT